MSIISWIVIGLICGAIGRAITGSKGTGGWLGDLLLGIVGAVVGGFIGEAIFHAGLGTFWSLRTWILSVIGSVIVLLIYGKITSKK
uniref:GlsB/YeaQ/YmgE family stress response membrane protein n=1 Tax=Vaginimicrobium propionicum TaxID=1871034 RepID=UPI000970CD3D|nr:GlsB/YeaQ/YmgE family stress response membrane protein [Vaginimicrobium propionicum]